MAHVDTDSLNLSENGAEHRRASVASLDIGALLDLLAELPPDQAGLRLRGIPALTAYLSRGGVIGAIAASVLGDLCRPVRAILFDKTATTNWSLPWHQDRTIAVAERREVEGFGPWTIKCGLLHVAPPITVLAKMLTLRVHLDTVSADNAPLKIAPGSHRHGRIAEAEIADMVARCGSFTCLADIGDVWLYATPILHASDAARLPARRRVLQVDYAVDDLPGGLRWLGV